MIEGTLTVAVLRRILSSAPDDAIVTVQCEHDGYVRYDHIADDAGIAEYKDVKVVRIFNDPAYQVIDLIEQEDERE